jgi:hypothetical protein
MSEDKYGFVYIWYDRTRKMFYIGSHWGREDDGYICSSNRMRDAYRRRPDDFRKRDGTPNRRILMRIYTSRENLLAEEQYWLDMIKDEELVTNNTTSVDREKKVRYYNMTTVVQRSWHYNDERRTEVGKIISAAKKGKSLPCTPEKAIAISRAKKIRFAERGGMSKEHKESLSKAKMGKILSEEHKANISKGLQSSELKPGVKKGHKFSDETKQKWSEMRKGHSPSSATLQASIKKCSKTYRVISPQGEEMIITNLSEFCRENNLAKQNIVRKSSKGWRACLISDA